MKHIDALKQQLAELGITLRCFDTARQAADYLDGAIDGVSVGFGGSVTVQQMELYPRLSGHNRCVWHWEGGDLGDAANTQVYISSVNAIARTGELINIDGNCNRVASTLYGHQRVYLVAGVNKLAEDYDAALWRARNIAAPKNAQRLNRSTPCAAKGDRCYDCKSPDRICRALTVLWGKPMGVQEMELILIDEELGM